MTVGRKLLVGAIALSGVFAAVPAKQPWRKPFAEQAIGEWRCHGLEDTLRWMLQA